MSETKFTPGPWSISPQRGYIRKDGAHGWNIAKIEEQAPYTEANAKLIAAAPEMYEALIDVVENLLVDFPDDDARKVKFKNIIQKATL